MTPQRSLLDQVPEPRKDWTETHEAGEGIEGTISERNVYTTRDGDEFTVVIIQNGSAEFRVPLSRSDLRGLTEAREGDRVAVKFWGKSGPRFVYTFVTERPGQGVLAETPAEHVPAPGDDDAPSDSS